MTKFYTRSGDDGYTGRLGKGRLPKNHPIIEAIGAIDEASAMLGFARSHCQTQSTSELLVEIQRDLYNLMAELSATKENAAQFRVINAERIAWLERQIDLIGNSVDIPKEFIVPGDSTGGATFAITRTVVRRAERRIVELQLAENVTNPNILPYLNRLSSLCFLFELQENQLAFSGGSTLAKTGS